MFEHFLAPPCVSRASEGAPVFVSEARTQQSERIACMPWRRAELPERPGALSRDEMLILIFVTEI